MATKYFDTSVRRIPVRFHKRTFVEASGGRKAATYVPVEGTSMANVKTKGGTPTVEGGVLSIIETATVTTAWRPDVSKGDRAEVLQDGSVWEILHVENVDYQNRDMVLTVRRTEEA